MTTVRVGRTIAQPPSRVFAHLADARFESSYDPHVLRCHKVTEGPVRAGTRFREAVLVHKRPAVMVVEVMQSRPPFELMTVEYGDGKRVERRWRLRPSTGGTRVEEDVSVRPPRGLRGRGAALRAPWLRRRERRRLAAVKRHLESPLAPEPHAS